MNDLKKLEKKVRERQKLVTRIFKFVERIAIKCGTCTYSKERSYSTHTIYELKGVNNFSFKDDDGQNYYGDGHDICVYYQDQLVCQIHCGIDEEKLEVRKFAEGKWLEELRVFMKNFRKAIAEANLSARNLAEINNKLAEDERKAGEKRSQLEKEARRLGL